LNKADEQRPQDAKDRHHDGWNSRDPFSFRGQAKKGRDQEHGDSHHRELGFTAQKRHGEGENRQVKATPTAILVRCEGMENGRDPDEGGKVVEGIHSSDRVAPVTV